jgi:hypothetical protein
MQDVAWDRAAVAQSVADRLWLVMTSGADHLADVLPHAAAVLQLPRTDVAFLRSLHLALSPEAGAMIEAAPDLLRTLRSTTATSLESHPDRLRGPVAWGETTALWARSGWPSGYATRPVQRDYDTPESRLLSGSLRVMAAAVVEVEPLARSGGGGVGDVLHARLGSVRHARATPVMRHLTAPPSPADLGRVERGRGRRRMQPVTTFWTLADRLTRLEDRTLLRRMVEQAALVTTDTGALMESLVLFRSWEVLEQLGWVAGPPRLVRGRLAVHFARAGEPLTLHYQQVPSTMAGSYARLLREHGLPASSLRPDLVLSRPAALGTRRVVVEVKYRHRAVDGARQALLDLLAYRDNYGAQSGTAWLGVAWGKGLAPNLDSEVWLCTLDRLVDGLRPLAA